MRIIAGNMRGLKLKSPKGQNTRPTSDRVKESLFNILGYIESDSIVLDLFSGSGNIGLEFLSRGAKKVYFIEKDPSTISLLKENIKKCKAENITEVYRNDVLKSIEIFEKKRKKFDYIFLDPPYNIGLSEKVLAKIASSNLLNEKGLIIVEHEVELEFNECYGLEEIDRRSYGSTGISFFRKQE